MPADAQAYLHAHIPISRHLGISVVRADGDSVVLHAPLEPNLNHEANAFGGSISAVAILAAWTYLYRRLPSVTEARRIVIQRSRVEYRSPIGSDFTATCRAPADDTWSRFCQTIDRRRKGRIVLTAEVDAAGVAAARFEGVFVVTTEPAAS